MFRSEKIQSRCIAAACLGVLFAGCDSGSLGSKVGEDKTVPPTARLSIIGATSDGTEVRSGSKVIFTAKNSIAGSNPVVGWRFEISGPGTEDLELVEEAANSRSLEIPQIAGNPQWEVQLTVIDAEDNSSTDSATINIVSVADAARFLSYRSEQEYVDIVVALAPGQVTTTEESFTVEVSSVLVYPNRNALEEPAGSSRYVPNDEIVIGTTTVAAAWPGGLTASEDTDPAAYQPATAYFNPRFRITMPRLDIESVNSSYEREDRHRQLDPWKVDSAHVELRISADGAKFLEPGNPVQLIFVRPLTSDVLMTISPADTLNVDDLQNAMQGIESRASAEAYYQVVDGSNDNGRMSAWLERTGFLDANGDLSEATADAHTIYLNNYDLGFGRDMYVRRDEFGNVYSFVTNYPTLESAIDKRDEFLTVAMEYSPPPDELPSSPNKFVKFFAFAPDETGDSVRVLKANFDGRGERYLPGSCTVCHGGLPRPAAEYDPLNPLSADISASFMPWDLDSFLYSAASDSNLVDPEFQVPDGSVNESLLPDEISRYSRESQEADFRTMNSIVLDIHRDYVDQARIPAEQQDRFASAIDLISGWYSTDSPCGDETQFCGDYVPIGWQSSAAPIQGVTSDPVGTYRNVFARNCRACHAQIQKLGDAENGRDFDSYDEFVGHPLVRDYVFGEGYMPFARLTADRFWVDFHGGPAAASLLQGELGLAAEDVPGSSQSFDAQLQVISSPVAGELLRQTEIVLQVDAESPSVQSVEWQNLSYDVGAEATACDNSNGAAIFESTSDLITTALDPDSTSGIASHASFVADVPGTFSVTASVTSEQGIEEEVTLGPYFVRNNCPEAQPAIPSVSVVQGGASISVDLRSVGIRSPGDVDVAPRIFLTAIAATNVSATVDQNGVATITCGAGCLLQPSSVTFRIFDDDEDFVDGTLPVDVTAAPVPNGPGFDATSPPVDDLIARTSTFNPSESLNIDVLSRTSGGIGTRTISITGLPSDGVLTANGGTVTYTPDLGFVGIDTFTYNVTDSNPASPQTSEPDGIVSITVDGFTRFDTDINQGIFNNKGCVSCHTSTGSTTDPTAVSRFNMGSSTVYQGAVDHLTSANNLFTYPPSGSHTGSAFATSWGVASDCPSSGTLPYCVFLRWQQEGACDIDSSGQPDTDCPD